MSIDLLPTVVELVGIPAPRRPVDGMDIWPLLSDVPDAESPHEVLYFYYRSNHLEALRAGRWKLVLPHKYRSLTGTPGQGGSPGGYTQQPTGLALYDLHRDPGETLDLSSEQPVVVLEMQALAEQARADLGDATLGREGAHRRLPRTE